MFQRLGNRKKMQETINIVNTITKGIEKIRISKQRLIAQLLKLKIL